MENLEKVLADAKEKVTAMLPEIDSLSQNDAEHIIGRYVAAFEGNFVIWMAATALSARSLQGRHAAEENLYVEIRNNHPGMLRDFAGFARAEPTAADYHAVHGRVDAIQQIVRDMSGLENLTLMAALENLSVVFIPYLANLARKCGSDYLLYTDIHGEADIAHAQQFLLAYEHEKYYYTGDQEEFLGDVVLTPTFDLLRVIFVPDAQKRKI